MRKKIFQNQQGFSLIELIVVVAVIGILIVVMIPKVGGAPDKAKLAGVKSDFLAIETAVRSHFLENSKLPKLDEINKSNLLDYELVAPSSTNNGDSVYKDPWNQPYSYNFKTDKEVEVSSSGPIGYEHMITVTFSIVEGRLKVAYKEDDDPT
ncbi:prepilin-type N-terminal cleavage/methylation domain-containing protein [Heliorestis acidaminivorans]|uniref:Prepilin-type N-terminal cleavage/methylation domain-containing protein n=1 Tax=Heliorestis acidaminivorans TaxID=553427 RepID=A0A6I0ER72_9FIRM|nr:prepilin-type N-terminal cleavage/methylation domain-containing protein [Heliorestis acidaminivorans]KAB2952746.1 prepilin-type N-terminal cleavage/methylation domain-containing protein [Heliorestis acidaminivorans]